MKVIITGANRGIGCGIATFLGREGFQLGLLARDSDKLKEVERDIRDQGGECWHAPCDIRDDAATEAAIDKLANAMNGVDALINNAGIVTRKDAFTISLDEWRAMVDTNLNGLFYATRAVLPMFREQRHGHIINVSSISGKVPLPGGSGYAATKFAVTGFSQSLFHEVRDYNIKVTTIYPGSVDSESHRHDASADHGWKVKPEEVGQACRDILRMSAQTLISELEIRPLGRPPKC